MTVTIWNPALNEGGGGVHIHVEVTGFDMSDPENPVPIEESTTLTKQVGRCWTRRGWPKPVRIDPNRDVGNTNPDLTGLIILDDMTTPASIPADQKRGPDRGNAAGRHRGGDGDVVAPGRHDRAGDQRRE
jgi:hypothetical protein